MIKEAKTLSEDLDFSQGYFHVSSHRDLHDYILTQPPLRIEQRGLGVKCYDLSNALSMYYCGEDI